MPTFIRSYPGNVQQKYNANSLSLSKLLSRVRLFATPWTVARQAPLSMEFSWQEYWSGLSCPPPRDLPYSRMELASLVSPALQVDSLVLSHWGSPLSSAFRPNYQLTQLHFPVLLDLDLITHHCFVKYSVPSSRVKKKKDSSFPTCSHW